MKKCIFIIFYLINIIYLNNPLFSQSDTSKCLSFFPLNIGNKWQYEVIPFYPPYDTTYYSVLEVVADTIMPNDMKYLLFNKNNRIINYLRVDTTDLKIYQYKSDSRLPNSEVLFFDLNPHGNFTTLLGYEVVVDSGFDAVGLLPDSSDYYSYFWYYGVDNYFKLSQGIGISHWYFWEVWGWQGHLVYAEINGIKYGQINSVENANAIPNKFELLQNYPNPFNSTTAIEYKLPYSANVKLSIFNINGRLVNILINRRQDNGEYKIKWHADRIGSGIYFIVYQFNQTTVSQKCLLTK